MAADSVFNGGWLGDTVFDNEKSDIVGSAASDETHISFTSRFLDEFSHAGINNLSDGNTDTKPDDNVSSYDFYPKVSTIEVGQEYKTRLYEEMTARQTAKFEAKLQEFEGFFDTSDLHDHANREACYKEEEQLVNCWKVHSSDVMPCIKLIDKLQECVDRHTSI